MAQVLCAIGSNAPAVTVPSPPGAGKTGLVERAAIQESVLGGHVVGIATTTRSQARDLVMRLRNWEGAKPIWFVPQTQRILDLPEDVSTVRSAKALPEENAIVVATAAKWARTKGCHLPLLVCDEAWQMSFAAFAPLVPLADRFLLVGDPGQISPVTRVDLTRWNDDPNGPHIAAPEVLAARAAGAVIEIPLPATRRLPADTATVVSDAFYPGMAFGSLAEEATVEGDWPTPERSLALLQIGEPYTGTHDPWLAAQAALVVKHAIAGAYIVTEAGRRPVSPRDIGVICPYIHQVPAVRSELGAELGEVFVETANRWQGLERPLVVALHPLSGQPEPSGFAMDAGRLCVMCSRHKVACVLLSRPGIVAAAAAGSGGAGRSLSPRESAAHRSWQAHAVLLGAMAS